MCKGRKSCRACARMSKAKVAGMNTKSTSKIITTGLSVAGGVAIGRVVSKVPVINANPMLRIAAPVVGAIVSKKFLGKKGDGLAAGMVTASLLDAVATYAPGVAAQTGIAGLGGPMKSLHLPGVAGHGRARVANQQPVHIRMQ